MIMGNWRADAAVIMTFYAPQPLIMTLAGRQRHDHRAGATGARPARRAREL